MSNNNKNSKEEELKESNNIENNTISSTNNSQSSIQKISFSHNLVINYPFYENKNIYNPELFINNFDFMDRYICGLCKNICDNPRYEYCGCESVFCKKCLDLYYESNNNKCPKCQKETRELIPNNSFNESILNLNMRCKNLSCKWTGKFKDYKKHITKNCPKEFINCPNKGCIIKLRREEIPKHIVNCEYNEYICNICQTKMKMIEKNTHKNICPKEKIKCPRKCGDYIERDKLMEHEKICPNSYIDCPYSIFLGCKDKFMKKEKEERITKDTCKHLDLAIEKIQKLSNEINNLNSKVAIIENERNNLNNRLTIIENDRNDLNNKITIIENERNDLKKEIKELKEIMLKNYIKINNEINSINIYQNSQNFFKNENPFEKMNDMKNIKSEIIDKNFNNNTEKIIKEESIKKDLSNSPEIKLNSSYKSCEYLSKKRKLSISNPDINSNNISNREFSLFANNNNNEDISKEKEDILDYIAPKKGNDEELYNLLANTNFLFSIRGNIIESIYLKGDKHYFVFFNPKYDIPRSGNKKYSFRVTLLEKSDWLGIGLCDKKIVEKNNYQYDIKNNGKKRNLGVYIININKLIWNCNNIKQCIKLDYKSLNKKGTIIECTLSPNECELEFMLNNEFFFVLNDVRCFISDFFSPCLIFLKNGAIETAFNYN